jgi:ribosome-binding protein aMBF1 (putative translation factor)
VFEPRRREAMARRIVEVRRAKRWSRAELAHESGASVDAIAGLEEAAPVCDIELLEVAAALDVCPWWLVFGFTPVATPSRRGPRYR